MSRYWGWKSFSRNPRRREPLFATPCCKTSRATWSTPSEPPHKKPFFEVLSFSAVFGTGCCCQLVCFEFGVLHFRLPLYTIPETGRLENTYSCCGFWLWSWLAAVVKLVCFEFVVLHFRLPIPETGRLLNTYVQRRNKNKKLAPPSRARGSTWGLFLQVC